MPTLLLDKEKCLGNMERMARKADSHHLSLRPHCKTHQSAEIANWFRDFGVKGITVSSFHMARYFAEAAWNDIVVAFPFQPGELEDLQFLSEKNHISILVDSPAALPFLNRLQNAVGFYIDIDTGYGRTGVRTENPELIEQIIAKARGNPKLHFQGFYCHAGHSYKARSQKEREAIHQKSLSDLEGLKQQFSEHGPRVLYGDTPNCSTQDDYGSIDELTPGNFVFYDLVQHTLGVCTEDEIAVAMECPVAGKYHHSRQILIHGGAVHFSKESLSIKGNTIFGRCVQRSNNTWTTADREASLTSLSQEHGVVESDKDLFSHVNIGDKLLFLPVHSCLTANLAKEYRTLDGRRIKNIHSH